MLKVIKKYIGKALQTTVIWVSIAAFVGGGMMLCCLPKAAQASITKTTAHCHSGKNSSTDHSKDCNCCKIKLSDSETLVRLFETTLALAKHFHAAFLAESFVVLPRLGFSSLAYTGPPKEFLSIPLYLQFSVLRL